MIFVAVGTTDFDALIIKMDEVAPCLSEPVVMQIGDGQYIPKNAEYFRFAPSLEPYYDEASLVVSHGGLGITTEALAKGKKLVGVENISLHGGHQVDLLRTLAHEGYLIWCRDLNNLLEEIKRAEHHSFKRYVAPDCAVHIVINKFLQNIG
jgi:UDP-N-acetylglucosamine transferase subunit ALG13